MAVLGQFEPLVNRLERHIKMCPATGCWLFTGKQDKDGYGTLHNRSKSGGDYKAHRVAWECYRGEIPENMDVAHHCDVRCCVNPGHLYIATRKQNLEDRTKRMREPRGEECSWSKLTASQVQEARDNKWSSRQIADVFGVNVKYAWAIRTQKTWRHIGG